MKPSKWLQPRSYHAFRCIGDQCEDTCCVGWIVNVDQATNERYQRSDDPELGPKLRELVTINAEYANSDNYARINLSGPGCPFLADGWCGIQQKLGEEYLSMMCSAYPRVVNVVDDTLQRSLDLSCPEAARVVLLDPEPIQFDEEEGPPRDPRFGNLSILRTSDESSPKPYRHFREIRAFVIWLLQNRSYPLWNRLAILASLCDQLQLMAETGQQAQTLEALAAYRDGVERRLFDEALQSHRPQHVKQLELVLELIVARIQSDYTAPRLRECYRKFMSAMDWAADVNMDELGRRYAAAHEDFFQPFLREHQYMLENYLVSYVHRTLFPLGAQESTYGLSIHRVANTIRDQYLLMAAYFGITQTLLIGMAAFYKEQFGTAQAIEVIQSFTKAFEHSPSFAARSLEMLRKKGVTSCVMLAILLMN
ncbi:MAG TPA: flagellin lysine-N-methylase [Bryobacteraceae bacterium]|nr:flagellin lysine-N-methylase [Bryobacteraceae bacterium]